MSGKNLLKHILSLLLVAVLLVVDIAASAAVLTFETQYDYESPNLAWLTDLVIKEDMTTIDGVAERTELIPLPEYPYTETPESFAEEVDYFTALYNLSEGSQRAGYIYFFEVLNEEAGIIAGDISDDDIREYLESSGIVYPDAPDADELVIARALFTVLVAGNVNGNLFVSGMTLEEVLVNYLTGLTGMNAQDIKDWMPESSVLSLDEYILAASKLSLWTSGYDVTADTPEDEVYRLVAVMTVKSLGLTVDSELSFEELNIEYIASLLSEKYGVFVESSKLAVAMDNDSVAYYILQLMGKDNGLSIREDNSSYEDAFYLVAENSDIFDVENGEFYADITEYEVYLEKRVSSLWIYPTAYSTNRENSVPVITVNGVAVRNNYYTEIDVDASAQEQELVIVVTVSEKGNTYSCTYTVKVHQGTYASVEGDAPANESKPEDYSSSDSVVLDVLSALGVNLDVTDILNGVFAEVPSSVTDIISYIAPTFGGSGSGTLPSTQDVSVYLALLDDIGAQENLKISGIPEIDIDKDFAEDGYSKVTFGE